MMNLDPNPGQSQLDIPSDPGWREYSITLGTVVAAGIIRWLLDPFLGDHLPFPTFFLSVIFASWIGGLRTAALATFLGFVWATYQFVPPRGSLAPASGPHAFGLLIYLMVSLTTGWFGEAARLAQARAAAAYKLARDRAEVLRVILAMIGDAVITTDPMGNVTYLNQVASTLTGVDQAQAVGRPIQDVFRVIDEQSRVLVENPVDRVLRQGRAVGMGKRKALIHPDGSARAIDDTAAPILDDRGDLLGAILVFRDI